MVLPLPIIESTFRQVGFVPRPYTFVRAGFFVTLWGTGVESRRAEPVPACPSLVRASFRQLPKGHLVKTALLIAAALLCLPAANAVAGCHGRCRLGVVVAPVVVQPVPVQPVPVVPVRHYYATPLRDLLFGRYRYVPVCPKGNCDPAPAPQPVKAQK